MSNNIEELIAAKKSMLGAERLPVGYAAIEDELDVKEALFKDKDERLVRIHIVWDNRIGELPLEEVLDRMRETGAAMVRKVERIDP